MITVITQLLQPDKHNLLTPQSHNPMYDLLKRLKNLVEHDLERTQLLKTLKDLPPNYLLFGLFEREVAFYLGADEGIVLDD